MERVLVANIFGIGDVLFTAPLIASLKKAIPGISVDYVCNARTRDVVESIPGVGDIYVHEKDDVVRLWRESWKKCFNTIFKRFKNIRGKKYDAVFDFTLSREFGIFFALAGIPRRIGLDYRGRGLFLTDRVRIEGFEDRHVVEYYLDLLGPLGLSASEKNMTLIPAAEKVMWAERYLEEKSATGGRIAAVIPGGGASWGQQASRKRWPREGFSAVADRLLKKGIRVLLLGGEAERELCLAVADGMKEKEYVVETGLGIKEYIALLSKCGLAVCNDGGPLHMAVALGLKTVSMFGPVDERVYGPYPASDRHRVITAAGLECRPCYSRFRLPECDYEMKCLTDIKPEEVVKACEELLEEKI